jgi:hypothetical protein
MFFKTAALTLLVAVLVRAEPIPQDATTTDYAAAVSACIPPTSLIVAITDYPTAAPDVLSYLSTAGDYCSITNVPKSITADWASYTGALSSWEKVNGAKVSSELSAISSFYSSASGNPICKPYLPSTAVAGVTGCSGAAATGTTTGKGSSSTGAASGNSTSGGSSSNAAVQGATGSVVVMIGGFVASCLAAVAVL